MMRIPKDETNISAGDYVAVIYGGDSDDYVFGWGSGMNKYVGMVFKVGDISYTKHNGRLKPYASLEGTAYLWDVRYLEKIDYNELDDKFDDFINSYVNGDAL